MIKLIVFDIDGTILNSKKQVLENTRKAFQSLKDKGYKIAIASGRPPIATKIKQLNDIEFDYYICSNGTIVVDNNDKVIFKSVFDNDFIEEFTNDCEKDQNSLLFSFIDGNYSYVNYDIMDRMLLNTVGKERVLIDDTKNRKRHLIDSSWAAILIDKNNSATIYKSKYKEIDFIPFRDNEYDVFHTGYSKASGIKIICDIIGIKMDNVMSFGDHYNDYEMIRDSGIGIAMSNAVDKVKNIADYITDSNDNDGVYKCLEKYKII